MGYTIPYTRICTRTRTKTSATNASTCRAALDAVIDDRGKPLSVGRMDNTGGFIRFGLWLSRQRKAQDLTQEDLAERLGCSVWSIQKMEVGNRRPSKQVAEIMADYFN